MVEMPKETQDAVNWALSQIVVVDGEGNTKQVTVDMMVYFSDKVREYFNIHNIEYSTYDYNDLKPYFPKD